MSTDIHRIDESVTDWLTALRYLEAGNRRFRERGTTARVVDEGARRVFSEGQSPFAAVVTCADSRVPPEIYFDLGPGDIFVVRTAGNTADVLTLGAVEFAVGVLGVPLVAVMSHTCCAAVINAYNDIQFPGDLRVLMGRIRPIVKDCRGVDDAIRANAAHTIGQIRANAVVKNAGAAVIGGHYEIESNTVTFPDRF